MLMLHRDARFEKIEGRSKSTVFPPLLWMQTSDLQWETIASTLQNIIDREKKEGLGDSAG